MRKRFYAVAIDGPSGAGKSTLAKKAAERLHFLYVDTGAIYRSIAWYAMDSAVPPEDAERVAELLPLLDLQLCYGEDGLQHMLVNGRDVTAEIRLPEVSAGASKVAAIPRVREYLLAIQRQLAETHDVIMDGRDIGTVVLPQADCKVFLTASAEVRAQRRCKELEERGTPQTYETVLKEMRQRDEQDRTRVVAPLRRAGDALLLDTSLLTFEESAQALERLIKEKIDHET